MTGFAVTYARYTRESIEQGDASEHGFLIENGTLRECIEELNALNAIDSIEPDCWPISRQYPPRSFRATQGTDRYLYMADEDDEGESRTLHIPEHVTTSSRLRIARLLGLKLL